MILYSIDCNTDNTRLKKSAVQKEATPNPPTILSHNNIITALITNKNKPKVKIVNGSVKITNIGLIKILSNPKTTATITAVLKSATYIPDIIFGISSTKTAVAIILKRSFISNLLFKFLINVKYLNLIPMFFFLTFVCTTSKLQVMKKILLSIIIITSFGANAQFWTEKGTGFSSPSRSLNSISIVNTSVIWALAFDNTDQINTDFTIKEFTRSTDGGNTWTAGTIDLGLNAADMESSSITAISETTAWITASPGASNTGGVWKTTDGGISWNKQTTAIFNSYPNFVYFWDANNGIAQGDPESGEFTIYTTTNGGVNWTQVPGTNIPDPIAAGENGYYNLYSVSGNTIWFGTDKGRIYKSTDKGLNWTVNTTPSTDFGLDQFTFSDANKGLLMLYNSVSLYNTTDGGANWTLVPKTGSLFNSNITYIPGTSTAISSSPANPIGSSYSLDNGLSWTTIDTGIFHGELAFLNDTFGFSSGLNTNATTDGISKYSGIPALKNPAFESKNALAIYPNPSNGNIQIDNKNESIKQVTVYDLLGKQVFDSNFPSLNTIDLDLKSLRSGEYLLKVTSDSGKTETKKIVKK